MGDYNYNNFCYDIIYILLKMPNVKLIIGICLLLLLVLGAGKRFYLSQYEEECYEYGIKQYVINITYDDYVDGNKCLFQSDYWGLNCSVVTKYWYFNSTRLTDECIKYHLVRKV